MDKAMEALLTEYEERSRREWAGERPVQSTGPGRDQMLLSVGREAGMFLNQLARGVEAKVILELGTSYGYSTLWLAEAAKATGGKVLSLDVADYKQAFAKETLASVGLDGFVEFHCGDALQILKGLKGPFDLVLLDIWKDVYVPALDLFYPNLAAGAVIVADNMLQPAQDRTNALNYRRAVRAKPKIASVLLPIGQGLEISRMQGPQDVGL